MNNRLNGDDEIDYAKGKTINLEFSMDSLHVASGIMYGNINIFISYKQTYTAHHTAHSHFRAHQIVYGVSQIGQSFLDILMWKGWHGPAKQCAGIEKQQ